MDTEQHNNSEQQEDPDTSQIRELIKVRFWGNPKVHTFRTEGQKLRHGQFVVAESDRGKTLGLINSFPYQKKVPLDLYSKIERLATEEDIQLHHEKQRESQEAKRKVLNLVDELKLKMVISHVTIMDFSSKMVIYFTAPERVDFRELLRRLRKEFSQKIELCQISQKQKAEALGAFGSCGHTSSLFLQSAKKSERKRLLGGGQRRQNPKEEPTSETASSQDS